MWLAKKLTNWQVIIVLVCLWLAATLLRITATAHGNFPFWFDLGRDAIISREILEQGDLKIQGPNASGTNDTIYHGVLYYYLIGPLYTIFGGDPQAVLMVMTAFASLGVVPIFLMARSFSDDDRVAVLTGLFYVLSYEFFTATTWLSNPIITTISLPAFFWLFWLVFFKKLRHLFPVLMITLAITHQSVILFAPWWGLIAVGFLMEYTAGDLKKWQVRHLLWGAGLYLLLVSTMILAQFKAYQAGIFTAQSVGEFASWSVDQPETIGLGMARLIYLKTVRSLLPSLPVISLALAGYLCCFAKSALDSFQKKFLLLVISSPLWLLGWHYRYVYHAFITLEFVPLMLLALWLIKMTKVKIGKTLAILCLVVFAFSNFKAYKTDTVFAQSTYFVPQGAYFKDLLAAIDFTYEKAGGRAFTISTFTNPYGYNTMWAYLYHWYGLAKYGYLPSWYGPDQTGIFGGNLLTRADSPATTHFSIREPGEGIPIWLISDFNTQQENIAKSEEFLFGTLEVRMHRGFEELAE